MLSAEQQQQLQQQLALMQQRVVQQDALVQQQQQQIAAQQLQLAVPAPASAAPARAPQPRIAAAPTFSGGAATLDVWLREMRQQCSFYQLPDDAARLVFLCAQLRGGALEWWDTLPSATRAGHSLSLIAFEAALRKRFQPVNAADSARTQLDSLRQGPRQSVHEYTSAFHRLLTSVPDMSAADQLHRYLFGLRPALQTQLRIAGVASLDAAIEAASRIGAIGQFATGSAAAAGYMPPQGDSSAMDLNEVQLDSIEGLEPSHTDPADDAAPVSRAEFRQLLNALQQQRGAAATKGDSKRAPFGRGSRGPPKVQGLSPGEVRKRLDAGACFGCGQTGHRKADCPSKQLN